VDYSVLIIDMARYDAESESRVGGFRSFEEAKAYARDFVRRSVEDLRAPGQSAEELHRLWHVFGEDAVVVGGEERYAGSHDLGDFIRHPGGV
jgi:nucleotide-binding universal stress UspA family protein